MSSASADWSPRARSQRQEDGLTVHFDVTDNAKTVKVAYTGILPDLFSEGKGVVTKGRLGSDGVFHAEEVLAKHDEEYMPPEVASTLKTAHAEGVAKTAEPDQRSIQLMVPELGHFALLLALASPSSRRASR